LDAELDSFLKLGTVVRNRERNFMTEQVATQGYVISRSSKDDAYGVWKFQPDGTEILSPMPLDPGAAYDRNKNIIWIGGYFLEWGPAQNALGNPFYEYRLFSFDPSAGDPLAAAPLQHGQWSWGKFWRTVPDFGNQSGARKEFQTDRTLILIPLGTFVLNWIPTTGRGTYSLWNFDPAPTAPGTVDPVAGNSPFTDQGAFRDMQKGDELIPMNGYVLDRKRATGEFRLWSFDPQDKNPLAYPPIQRGTWSDIDEDHELVPIGDYVLDWAPTDRSYRLWRFDPKSANPLTGPVRSGTLPSVELDPEYAAAHVAIAECHAQLEWYGLESTTEAIPRVKSALEAGLNLEQNSVSGICLLATVQAGYDWDWAKAARTFADALAAGAGFSAVHFHYALDFLTPLGRLEEARSEILRALELDPLSAITSTALGGCYYRMRLWNEAAVSLRSTLELNPGFGHAHWSLGRVLLEQDRGEEALHHYTEGIEIVGRTPAALAELGYGLARLSRNQEARAILTELETMSNRQFVSPISAAIIFAGLEDGASVMSHLERAFEQRARQLVWINVDPRFDSLRKEPAFLRLISQIGIPVHSHSGVVP
jgi:tetratricopeptide (TPR) repeat protein